MPDNADQPSDSASQPSDGGAPGSSAGSPEDRGRQRVLERRRQVREAERREPLKVKILHALGEEPATPSTLAQSLGSAPETISRQLKELRRLGLVRSERVFGDLRRRRYSLTPAGETQLVEHRAFGERQPAPAPLSDEVASTFLWSALDRAVEMRHQGQPWSEVSSRIRTIHAQAEERGLFDLALEAYVELTTTQRQQRGSQHVGEMLQQLDRISLGRDSRYGGDLVAPAGAHYCYTSGRLARGGPEDVIRRLQLLSQAGMTYRRLAAAAPEPDRARRWQVRQAWSVASIAGALREQSSFEEARSQAEVALTLFQELDDPFGQSYCLFLSGFCLRLTGSFGHALERLLEAQAMAASHGFARFEVDALLQVGDVLRCMGDIDRARELLSEALVRSKELDRPVTMAFAKSALGAAAFQSGDYDAARRSLLVAQELFKACNHKEGRALNARRSVAVALRRQHSHSDFQVLHNLIARATELYGELGSPPGAAACHIEHARLHMRVKGNSEAFAPIDAIKKILKRNYDVLKKDLWLPSMLSSFAEEVADPDLDGEAKHLLADAPNKSGSRESVEMGGETRHTPPSQGAALTALV